ncbi:hypothetical protein JST97_26740 [bacterium]|nr:hypothetical protein [bacterium]
MKIGSSNISPFAPKSNAKPAAEFNQTPSPGLLPKELLQDLPTLSPAATAWAPPEPPPLPNPQSQAPSPAPSEAAPTPPPPPTISGVSPAQSKSEKWMADDWNIGPGPAASKSGLAGAPTPDDLWSQPKPHSNLHTKSMIIDDQATYFVGGNQTAPATAQAKAEVDPLLGNLAALAQKLSGENSAAKSEQAKSSAAEWAKDSMMNSMMMMGGAMFGGIGSMMGGIMGGMNLSSAYWPPPMALSKTDFNKNAAELHEKLHSSKPPSGLSNPWAEPAIAKASAPSATAPLKATEAVQDVKAVPTCAGMTKTEVTAGVKKTLQAMGVTDGSFAVDEKLFPSLEKLDMNPVEFFAARACWQGVNTKRRAVLEQVLDQFPSLPKDQKNWRAAVSAVETKGTQVTETDRYFIGYFIENRQKMKSLFRATLPSSFEGNSAVCYRGQDKSSKWGPHSTKPLGCYSIDPAVSEGWGSGNFKRFKVKLNDIWSTYTTLQNNHRCERELTVYSRGGIRRGEEVKDIAGARVEFNRRYENDQLAKSLEKIPTKTYL